MFRGVLAPEMLLDPTVIEDPVPFYRLLREQAPVWPVPGTDVVTVATFEALAEAVTASTTSRRTSPRCCTATTPGFHRGSSSAAPASRLLQPRTRRSTACTAPGVP